MGGTEIYNAIEKVVSSLKNKPSNLFILTDGEVSNPKKVLELIEIKMKSNIRFYTLGIGSGCSQYLI
jgi:uncharacterized protein with von Willebrand factor type A (vWA) domain